ncbi:uncharacterized protein LOC114272390 [Camellia sinensis]|uniref:uncharacterized protein LOC114272390 n=1 Tax=Camellia sinensis TaxID=4442 RepID=UPI001035DA1B|nr:uncharacterized protein LOC114272390 [Camellia sinensis]
MSPYRIVFGKPYHLLVELEHWALWVIRKFNFDMAKASDCRKLQLNELEELRNDAYDSSKIYNARTKAFHDKHISRESFEPHQKVWLFNAKLQLFPSKLLSWWDGPYEVIEVFPHGAVEIKNPQDSTTFKVNVQRLKHYVDDMSTSSRQAPKLPRNANIAARDVPTDTWANKPIAYDTPFHVDFF